VHFPTGSIDHIGWEGEVVRHQQLGRGNFGFAASASYLARFRKLGVTARANFLWNAPGRDGYRFGQGLTAQLEAFYALEGAKRVNAYPKGGLFLETKAADRLDGEEPDFETRVKALAATGGIGVSAKRWMLDAHVVVPVKQWQYAGDFKNKIQLNAGINFFISKTR